MELKSKLTELRCNGNKPTVRRGGGGLPMLEDGFLGILGGQKTGRTALLGSMHLIEGPRLHHSLS